jgi:hypothetical protein
LSELSDELYQFGEDVPPSRKTKKLRGLPDETSDIRKLTDMTAELLDCSQCGERSVSEVRLRLETFRSKSLSDEGSSLCLLVAEGPLTDGWHEFSIHGRQQWQKSVPSARAGILADFNSTKKQMFTGLQAQDWHATRPKHHGCICELLRASTQRHSDWYKFNIELDPKIAGVRNHKPQERLYKGLASQKQLTLKHLLASAGKDWTRFAKLSLAVIVSYSLFYLYGSRWACEKWSRLNITLFLDGHRMPLRPFLSSDPDRRGGPLNDPDGQHQYPEVLELGVILLEIHLGQSLESFLGCQDTFSEHDDLWLGALKVFQMRRLHIESLAHREAIKKCLAPDFLMDNSCDVEALRASLFSYVVQPLEEELQKNFGDELESAQSLDEVAERDIDLAAYNLSITAERQVSSFSIPEIKLPPAVASRPSFIRRSG